MLVGIRVSKFLLSEIRRWGHWKRGICINLSEIDFQFANKFAHNFAHPSSRNDEEAKLAQNLHKNLREAPFVNAPFSEFLKFALPDASRSGICTPTSRRTFSAHFCEFPQNFRSLRWRSRTKFNFLENVTISAKFAQNFRKNSATSRSAVCSSWCRSQCVSECVVLIHRELTFK